MPKVSGVLSVVTIEGSVLAVDKDATLTLNQAIMDTTARDSDWWEEGLAGLRGWEISGNSLYSDNELARKKLDYHYTARSPSTLSVIFAYADGTIVRSGEANLTNLTLTSPAHDAATYTYTLKGTGALTAAVS